MRSAHYKITKENLNLLYMLLVCKSLTPDDPTIFYSFLKDLLSLGSLDEHVKSPEDIDFFFTNSICDEKNNFQTLTIEGMNSIESLLIKINKHLGKIVLASKSKKKKSWQIMPMAGQVYHNSWDNYEEIIEFRVKTLPTQIVGINALWKIALEAKNEAVINKAIELLNKLYTKLGEEVKERIAEISSDFVETAIEKLKLFYDRSINRNENRSSEIVKVLRLIVEMIFESERKGNGGMTPLFCLYRGEPIHITVINNAVEFGPNSGIPDKFELFIHTHLTYWQLRMLVANKLKIPPEVVKVSLTGVDPTDKDNGKTMEEIHVNNGDTIRAIRRTEEFVSRADLLIGRTLTEKAKLVFYEIFAKFSTDGHMTKKHVVEFTRICLGIQ